MKKFFEAVWAWLKKAGAFVKKHWKVLAKIAIAALGVIAGVVLVKKIASVIEGIVNPSSKINWEPTPDPKAISVVVEPGAKPQIVPLPKGVTSDQVKAVGVDTKDNSILVVEVLHETVDRTHPTAISGSALDALGAGKPKS